MTERDLTLDELEHRVKVALSEIGKLHAFRRVQMDPHRRAAFYTNGLSVDERWLLRETVYCDTGAPGAMICRACFDLYILARQEDPNTKTSSIGCHTTRPFVRDCGRPQEDLP